MVGRSGLGGRSVLVRPVGRGLDRSAVRRAIAATPGGLMLESAAGHAKYGRYSIYGIGRHLTGHDRRGDPFDELRSVVAERVDVIGDSPIPFVGGWIGFLSYECGRFVEPFERQHVFMRGMPMARWCECDAVLVFDAERDEWFAAGCDVGGDGPSIESRVDALVRFAETASSDGLLTQQEAAAPVTARVATANMTREEYVRRVERALEYIRAGDIFQVNFAQRFTVPYVGEPCALYERLCETNPAMFAAYLAWDHDRAGAARSAVLSSSPELFVELRGRRVVTRPIKGTRRRSGDERRDAMARRELETSEKDAAELLMIVDLERNDLGRVCEYGSVRVTCGGETEAHPTVFHRVATVEGDLRGDCDAIDLLRATFPGGSITGAPKVRAMQIIDELEPDPRGPYCGAIGWIGVDGSMMLNLAIRTMCVVDDRAHLWAGGGIVADSDPQAEYEETLAKAEGMRRALA